MTTCQLSTISCTLRRGRDTVIQVGDPTTIALTDRLIIYKSLSQLAKIHRSIFIVPITHISQLPPWLHAAVLVQTAARQKEKVPTITHRASPTQPFPKVPLQRQQVAQHDHAGTLLTPGLVQLQTGQSSVKQTQKVTRLTRARCLLAPLALGVWRLDHTYGFFKHR